MSVYVCLLRVVCLRSGEQMPHETPCTFFRNTHALYLFYEFSVSLIFLNSFLTHYSFTKQHINLLHRVPLHARMRRCTHTRTQTQYTDKTRTNVVLSQRVCAATGHRKRPLNEFQMHLPPGRLGLPLLLQLRRSVDVDRRQRPATRGHGCRCGCRCRSATTPADAGCVLKRASTDLVVSMVILQCSACVYVRHRCQLN